MKTILLVEDDPIMGEALAQRLELEGFTTTWVRRLADAAPLMSDRWSAVVSDVRLPDGVATSWFAGLPERARTLPWFFLTGYGSVDDAVACIRAGAREYLVKPFDIEKLIAMIELATDAPPGPQEERMLGISASMRNVETLVRKVAHQRVSVLLTGESGVGKELAAQMIHGLDPRSGKGDFVAVNCAAVPDTMLEAEFFGYEKGAFSGANRAHRGFLERAHGGTLFLDEVGDLPAAMQAKLLRALQERCFFRLGAEKTTHSDFRVVAATNRDLYGDMAAGRFREDLFYRLAVVSISLPPLRERPEDIRWLTERILRLLSVEQGRPIAVSEPFMRDLMGRTWKGNVRELRSFLEQAVIFSDAGILDLPTDQDRQSTRREAAEGGASTAIQPLQSVVEETERAHIRRALVHCELSVSRTADLLGISRKTLWEKMKRLGVSVADA